MFNKNPQGINLTLQAFWIALSSLSSLLLAIVSAAILSRYLSKIEYGSYRQITYVYSSLIVIFSAGLPNIFSYYLPKINVSQGLDLVKKVNKILFLLGLCFGIFLFITSPFIAKFYKNSDIVIGLKYFSLVPIFLLPTLGLDGIFASYHKTIYLAIFNVLNKLIMLTCIVLPVVLIEQTAIVAIYGWIIGSILSFILANIFRKIPFKSITSEKSKISLNEMVKYSIPIVLASIWGLAIRYADQFYISHYFGAEVYAEFSNGFMEIPLVGIITTSAATILTPTFSKLSHLESSISDIEMIWKRTLLKSGMLVFPVTIFFFIFSEPIMVILFSNNYENSGLFFKINLLLNFTNIILFMPILLAFGKTKFYSNLHMYSFVFIWTAGFILLHYFKSPYYYAFLSVFNNIVLVFIAMTYCTRLLKTRISNVIPIRDFLIIIITCFLVAISLNIIHTNFLSRFSLFSILGIGLLYTATALYILQVSNLDYWSIIRPLTQKFRLS
jgi:O-antigen/teichoic acid export membrane protein